MLKSLVASSQKRVGLCACNKDVRLCCLTQPIAPSTRACMVWLYATTSWSTTSLSAQYCLISSDCYSFAPSIRKKRIFLPVRVTNCLRSANGDARVLLGKDTKYLVPLSTTNRKYRLRSGRQPRGLITSDSSERLALINTLEEMGQARDTLYTCNF